MIQIDYNLLKKENKTKKVLKVYQVHKNRYILDPIQINLNLMKLDMKIHLEHIKRNNKLRLQINKCLLKLHKIKDKHIHLKTIL